MRCPNNDLQLPYHGVAAAQLVSGSRQANHVLLTSASDGPCLSAPLI
jgi:hypothetical protein